MGETYLEMEKAMALNIQDLAIESPDIASSDRIPDAYVADHGNREPRITVTGIPEETVELAIIMHDPDAPLPNGFTHWVLYGVPPTEGTIEGGYRVGPNTLGEQFYSGPQPPLGHGVHHYYFWVYALNTKVNGAPSREKFLQKYSENIIEQNRFVAMYSA